MVKKTILAIAGVVLLVAVFASAAQKWGYTRYGAVYFQGSPTYMYYPLSYPGDYIHGDPDYYYPYFTVDVPPEYLLRSGTYGTPYSLSSSPYYRYGFYAKPYSYIVPESQSPLSVDYLYRYGLPSVTTPSAVGAPRNEHGGVCGIVNGMQIGCMSGLVCDYTKGKQPGSGACAFLNPDSTTYPQQVGSSATYAYYP